MSKSDYWNEKENEKYLKMKAGIEGQELDFKSVKKVSEISNKVIKIIAVISIIIGIGALAFSFFYMTIQWSGIQQRVNPNMIENMEEMFNEKFKILSCEKKESGEIYKLSPESNNKIVCTAYKKGASVSDDFQNQAFKYFVENILEEKIKEKLVIYDKYYEANEDLGVKLLMYDAHFEVKDESELEEYTELMKQIRKKALNEKRRVYNFITCGSWIRAGNYYSPVSYVELDGRDVTQEEKDNYIKYIEKNKKIY